MLGNFLSGLASRIFMISLPSVANGLGTDILGISWALISFQLASVSLSVVFGRLGDLYGRRRIYAVGFLVMTVSSLLCGLARDVVQLVVYRFLQGVGGAMTQSAGRALAMEAVPEGSGGKAQGLMTVAFHTGFLIGPPLGGLIIEHVDWRGIFFFLVPIGVAGLTLTYLRFRGDAPTPAVGPRPAVDYVGTTLFVALTTLLTLLLDRRAWAAFGAGQAGVLGLVFAGTLWGFVAHQRRTPSPMMNLALFRIPMLTYSILSLLAISMTHGLVGFLMPFYLQEVLHLAPSFMGLIFLAPPLFTITLATLSGQIADRVGPRAPATAGVVITMTAFAIGVGLRVDSHWMLPTALLALTGLGTAFFNTPNHVAIIGSVPREDRGFANGLTHTTFGLGNLLGVSLGAMLFGVAFQHYAGVPTTSPSAENPVAFVAALNVCYLGALGLGLAALVASVRRGGARVGGAPGLAH